MSFYEKRFWEYLQIYNIVVFFFFQDFEKDLNDKFYDDKNLSAL